MSESTSGKKTDDVQSSSIRKQRIRPGILIRRIHLYAGLFLLPWVFLYGITGAMFNHQSLFPEVEISDVSSDSLRDTGLADFPSTDDLARSIVAELQRAAPDSEIELIENHGAEFNNNVILEVNAQGEKHAVHIDPVERSARVVKLPSNGNAPRLLPDVSNIRLNENPYELAKRSVPQIMSEAGIASVETPRPRGWCKLNFLAKIDGEPARVTYVLRDGHVNITEYLEEGEMTPRQLFLRLHTSHGQPPHWNARMLWSLLLDTMAIAMVTWGITGLIMWWQLKRTRLTGAIVIASSVLFAASIYFSMIHFYATTKL